MELIKPYIESFLSQYRYSDSARECKGIITFDEIKDEQKRERVTSQMIDEYTALIERLGIKVEVDDKVKAIFITIEEDANLVLTPTQMQQKNQEIEYFRKNYES